MSGWHERTEDGNASLSQSAKLTATAILGRSRRCQTEAPFPGLKKDFPWDKFLGANAGGAGIVIGYFAVLFVHFFLLLAGLTGFLIWLLLARLLSTAVLLAGFSALLVLLRTLIGHHVHLEVSIHDNAPLWPNVPDPAPIAVSFILFRSRNSACVIVRASIGHVAGPGSAAKLLTRDENLWKYREATVKA